MATLYRKYRSQRFDDVIGQNPIVTTLTNQIKLGRIGHAYLFTGSRGVGKTSCARIFARAVNCLNPVGGSPCGECEVCKKLAVDNVDIIEMDAASNNGVDDARDIREKVKYLPIASKYKVYIIDEVHMLTGGAFNALLKTIEEPPDHVIFILATTEPQKLPQTILSRCIRFDFRLVPNDILAKHIAHIYDLEGIQYTQDAVEEIARLGEGSVRDALSVADTLASAADRITAEVVLSLTGAGERAAIAELFDCVLSRDLKNTLLCIDRLVGSGKSMSAVCRQLIDFTRNALVAKSIGREKASTGTLINADRATLDAIIASADKHSMPDISRMLTELGAAETGLKYSVNPRVFLETALVKLISVAVSDDNILRRLAALEGNSAGSSAEQKKNKVNSPPVVQAETTARSERKAPMPVARQASVESDECRDDYTPEPPPERIRDWDEPASELQSGVPSRSVPLAVVKADEGEFMHKSATNEEGLELKGAIVRALRRSGDPSMQRIMRLIANGVSIKEREQHIAVVAPDAAFLQLSDVTVVSALNSVLTSLDISKRIAIERTEDDLFHSDVTKARQIFGANGVIVKPK